MKISKKLINDFKNFVELVPAKRFSQNTRTLLLCYLKYEMQYGVADFFEDHIRDLEFFFNLMDVIEEKCDQSELLKPQKRKGSEEDE